MTSAKCGHYAEIAGAAGMSCRRTPGHSGECSAELSGFTSHAAKRVETKIEVYWPSPKMLRRKHASQPRSSE